MTVTVLGDDPNQNTQNQKIEAIEKRLDALEQSRAKSIICSAECCFWAEEYKFKSEGHVIKMKGTNKFDTFEELRVACLKQFDNSDFKKNNAHLKPAAFLRNPRTNGAALPSDRDICSDN